MGALKDLPPLREDARTLTARVKTEMIYLTFVLHKGLDYCYILSRHLLYLLDKCLSTAIDAL